MTDTKQLKDEELKQVSGGARKGGDDHFDEVTDLLKEAGDKAWAVLGAGNNLWALINAAEKTPFVSTRIDKIQQAQDLLLRSSAAFGNIEDYNFINDKLIQSLELTNS